MEQQLIFGPVFALAGLTFLVWIYMYSKRLPFIFSLDKEPSEITPTFLATEAPPSVSTPSDNLKNLFEMPVLFYVLAIYLYVTGSVTMGLTLSAWLYVGFRVLHSIVHCTVNMVQARFALYLISSLILFYMFVRAVLSF